MALQKSENIVKTMLSDTILALCKNTLPYEGEFCVEGLLGITLDNKEIFLVNINETIMREEYAALKKKEQEEKEKQEKEKDLQDKESMSDSQCSDSDSQTSRKLKRKRKRRKKRKEREKKNEDLDMEVESDCDSDKNEEDKKSSDEKDEDISNSGKEEKAKSNDRIEEEESEHASNDDKTEKEDKVNKSKEEENNSDSEPKKRKSRTDSEHSDISSKRHKSDPPLKDVVKSEVPEEDDDDDDIVFVKEEPVSENAMYGHGYGENFDFAMLQEVSQPHVIGGMPHPGPSHIMSHPHANMDPFTSPPGGATGHNVSGHQLGQNISLSENVEHDAEIQNQVDPDTLWIEQEHFASVDQKLLCKLCKFTCAWPSTMRTHVRRHTGEKPFQCYVCARRFTQKGNLKAHMIIHVNS